MRRKMKQEYPTRYLLVTIDTEVDKSIDWRISNPVSFNSVTEGVPSTLSPLFEKYGVKPTYLLSPEVLEDKESCAVLADIGPNVELGTHLHPEFIEPERQLFLNNMPGKYANNLQSQYSQDVEYRKLKNLTELFYSRFGYLPTSFRSGRFGMSQHTFNSLARLGYKVDSSVTPGVLWDLKEGLLDYRRCNGDFKCHNTIYGEILEFPVSIRAGSIFAKYFRDIPGILGKGLRKVTGKYGRYEWLSPTFTKSNGLINYVIKSNELFMVLMFHSTEIIAGASPYATNKDDVNNKINSLDCLFDYAVSNEITFCTMTEAANILQLMD